MVTLIPGVMCDVNQPGVPINSFVRQEDSAYSTRERTKCDNKETKVARTSRSVAKVAKVAIREISFWFLALGESVSVGRCALV